MEDILIYAADGRPHCGSIRAGRDLWNELDCEKALVPQVWSVSNFSGSASLPRGPIRKRADANQFEATLPIWRRGGAMHKWRR